MLASSGSWILSLGIRRRTRLSHSAPTAARWPREARMAPSGSGTSPASPPGMRDRIQRPHSDSRKPPRRKRGCGGESEAPVAEAWTGEAAGMRCPGSAGGPALPLHAGGQRMV